MTVVPNWEVESPFDTDADLVRASAAGDRYAFATIYDRYADRLNDFCVGMLADRDAAADCVQDAFCIAATRLPQLREPDKLRPWLYSIARNEALRRLRDRKRETPSEDLPETMSEEAGPETLAARTELADLISDAAGGLSDRDRSVLELAFRHGLNGPDLGEALGVTAASANQIVHRLRETIERSLGALLVSRRVRNSGGCPALADILEAGDGSFNVLMRKRISRHIEKCDVCDAQRRRMVNPVALLGSAPAFVPAPAWLREKTLSEIQLTCAAESLAGDIDKSPSQSGTHGYLMPVTAFVIALLATISAVLLLLTQQPVSVTPTQMSTTPPSSLPVAPAASAPSPAPAPPVAPVTAEPPVAPSTWEAGPSPTATVPTVAPSEPATFELAPPSMTPVPTMEPTPPAAPPVVPPVQPTPPPLPPMEWPNPVPEWPAPSSPGGSTPTPAPTGSSTPPLIVHPSTPIPG